MRRAMLLVIVAAVLLPVVMPVPASAASAADVLSKINHIVVIYQENWSFDSLYRHLRAADVLPRPAPYLAPVSAHTLS